MERIDYDYMIVEQMEKLNRVLVPVTHPDYKEKREEISAIRRKIARLEREKKRNTVYTPPNYAELIENSQLGRERIGVYPYPDNPHNNREVYEKYVQHGKFIHSWATVLLNGGAKAR